MTKGGDAKSQYRLIAQHVRGDVKGPWRLIAYGNGRTFPPCHFRSGDELLRTMHLALPDRDPGLPATRVEQGEGYILFSEDVMLDEVQLSILGLFPSKP